MDIRTLERVLDGMHRARAANEDEIRSWRERVSDAISEHLLAQVHAAITQSCDVGNDALGPAFELAPDGG